MTKRMTHAQKARSLVLDQKDPYLDAPGFSSGESAALWAGVSLLLLLLTCGLWNLCGSCRTRISCRMQSITGARRKKKKLNPTEKRVNKILSNDSAREILKAHALTAMNSQANKRRRSHSASQLSLDSVGTVPDLTDRVVRVSFAPAGGSSAPAVSAAAAGPAADAEDEVASTSSCPPAYDTLSVRSTTSTEPPEYQAATQLA